MASDPGLLVVTLGRRTTLNRLPHTPSRRDNGTLLAPHLPQIRRWGRSPHASPKATLGPPGCLSPWFGCHTTNRMGRRCFSNINDQPAESAESLPWLRGWHFCGEKIFAMSILRREGKDATVGHVPGKSRVIGFL